METVFDMEPSSTSSTPTSLVSQCLRPGGQVRRGRLQGWATPVALWRHQNIVPTLGIREEMGPPRAPSTDAAGLGPGHIAAMVLAEELGREKIQGFLDIP